MADAADEADGAQALEIEVLMEQHRRAAAQHREVLGGFTGKCMNCDEMIEEGRFCDADCRIDHERRVGARLRR